MPRKFLRAGLPDKYVSKVSSHEWRFDKYGPSALKNEVAVRTPVTK